MVRTNHEDTSSETLCSQSSESNLAGDGTDRFALVSGLSELRDEGIGRVRDNGTNNTSDITRSESDTELGGLAVGILGLREDVGVEQLDGLLEEVKLGHGVGDLDIDKDKGEVRKT